MSFSRKKLEYYIYKISFLQEWKNELSSNQPDLESLAEYIFQKHGEQISFMSEDDKIFILYSTYDTDGYPAGCNFDRAMKEIREILEGWYPSVNFNSESSQDAIDGIGPYFTHYFDLMDKK